MGISVNLWVLDPFVDGNIFSEWLWLMIYRFNSKVEDVFCSRSNGFKRTKKWGLRRMREREIDIYIYIYDPVAGRWMYRDIHQLWRQIRFGFWGMFNLIRWVKNWRMNWVALWVLGIFLPRVKDENSIKFDLCAHILGWGPLFKFIQLSTNFAKS